VITTDASGLAEAGLERLYVLDCGQNIGKDQACPTRSLSSRASA
jgi:hypothetical protein